MCEAAADGLCKIDLLLSQNGKRIADSRFLSDAGKPAELLDQLLKRKNVK